MRNNLVVTNIAMKAFGGFALSQKTTTTTSCTTWASPELLGGSRGGICNILGFFFLNKICLKTSIDASSFGGQDHHNYNIWWLGKHGNWCTCSSDFFFYNFFPIKFWVDAYRSMCNCFGGHECRYQNVWWFRITVEKLKKKNKRDAPSLNYLWLAWRIQENWWNLHSIHC